MKYLMIIFLTNPNGGAAIEQVPFQDYEQCEVAARQANKIRQGIYAPVAAICVVRIYE